MNMMRGRKFTYLLLTVIYLVSVLLPASVAFAQTTTATDPKTSFNPAENPALKGYTLNTANGYTLTSTPKEGPDGSCKLYNAPGFGGGVVSGCVKDGVFYLNGSIPTVGTDGTGTTNASTNTATGQTTTTQSGGAAEGAGAVAGFIADEAFKQAARLVGLVAIVILGFSNLLLGIAGVLLNWVMLKTVFQYAEVFGNSAGLLIAWGILRDIGNIVLLFGFVFIGIATILDIQNYTAKRALIGLLIFAAALNFSLFAAEAVVDVSNVFTSAMYNQATHGDEACVGNKGDAGISAEGRDACAKSDGIAGAIMQTTGLGGLFGISGALKAGGQVLTEPQTATPALIGMTLFSIIGTVVMGATAIMLIIRAVILTLLIVASPIGFAGMAVPVFKSLGERWWKMLISQAFYAPVLILLILVSLKVSSSLTEHAAADSSGAYGALGSAIASHDPSAMGIILVYFIVIGFLVASLVAAGKLGAMGSSFAVNSASALTFGVMTRATNLGVGGGARLARYGIQNSRFKNSGVAKVISNRVLTPLQGANLDVRRTGVGAILKAAGATSGANAAEHATYNDLKHMYDDELEGKTGKRLEAQYQGQVKREQLEKRAHDGNMQEGDEQYLASLTVKELEELHGIKSGVAQLAEKLAPNQFEGLMKSDKLDAQQKDALATGYFGALNRAIEVVQDKGFDAAMVDANGIVINDPVTGQPVKAKDYVRGLSNKTLSNFAQHNANNFKQLANTVNDATKGGDGDSLISGDQFKALKDNEALMDSQRTALKVNSKNAQIRRFLKPAAGPVNEAAAEAIAKSIQGDIADLDSDLLIEPSVIKTFTKAKMAAIQSKNKLKDEEVAKIINYINDPSKPLPNRAGINTWLTGNKAAGAYWS